MSSRCSKYFGPILKPGREVLGIFTHHVTSYSSDHLSPACRSTPLIALLVSDHLATLPFIALLVSDHLATLPFATNLSTALLFNTCNIYISLLFAVSQLSYAFHCKSPLGSSLHSLTHSINDHVARLFNPILILFTFHASPVR